MFRLTVFVECRSIEVLILASPSVFSLLCEFTHGYGGTVPG